MYLSAHTCQLLTSQGPGMSRTVVYSKSSALILNLNEVKPAGPNPYEETMESKTAESLLSRVSTVV